MMFSACSDSPGAPGRSVIRTFQGGTGSLSVGLVDLPTDAKNVWVTLRDLNVRKCDGAGWTNLPLQEGTFDLLTLRDGLVGALADKAELPSGRYCELRLVVDSPARLVLTTGEEYDLKVPSGSSSGVKVKGEFLIVPGLDTKVIVDFDADASIHEAGSGHFQMKPVLRVERVDYEGTTGTSIAGASLSDFTSFHVEPSTDGIVTLPGGATLEFASGAVPAPQDFTVTVWTPRLSDALANIYVFTPSFEFLNTPIFSLPVKNGGVAPTIYWDYESIPTQWTSLTQDTKTATAAISHFSCGGAASRFDGFSNAQWFSDPIVDMEWRGVFDRTEFSNDYFDPALGNAAAPMKREEVVALIVRAAFDKTRLDLPVLTERAFDDVPTNHKFARYIAYAKSLGITKGCGDGTNFCLGATLERAEMAAMITRVLKVKGNKEIVDKVIKYSSQKARNEFVDVPQNSPLDWFYPYVYAVRDDGLMIGYENTNTFAPAGSVSRVEAAKVVCYLAYTKQKCGVCKTKKYNPEMGASYARKNAYVLYEPQGSNRFHDFGTQSDGGNCANYGSQSLLGGLLESDSLDVVYDRRMEFADKDGTNQWYWNDFGDFGDAFIKTDYLRSYVRFGSGYRGLQFKYITTISPNDWAEYTSVHVGDIVFADFQVDDNFDHVFTVAGLKNIQDPNAIRLAAQTNARDDFGMKDVWSEPGVPNTVFEIYRPEVFRK
jgi:hypothetical protein